MSIPPHIYIRITRQLGTSLLAVVFLLGNWAGLVHFALVEHGICAEHGQAVHAAHGARLAARANGKRATAPSHRLVLLSGNADLAHEHHQHCTQCLLACTQQRFSAQTPSLIVPHVVADGDALIGVTVALPSQSGFGVAPKQSPPV